MGITQCVKRAVQENPYGRAVVCGARARRWDEFGARVARFAGGLQSLGVRHGDHTAEELRAPYWEGRRRQVN